MKTKIKEGNYAKLGVCQEQEWTNFTFCGEKEDKCYVVLTNTITGTVKRIEVPQAYYVGSLRLQIFPWKMKNIILKSMVRK
mgnify:CR=1 FL=1